MRCCKHTVRPRAAAQSGETPWWDGYWTGPVGTLALCASVWVCGMSGTRHTCRSCKVRSLTHSVMLATDPVPRGPHESSMYSWRCSLSKRGRCANEPCYWRWFHVGSNVMQTLRQPW